MNGRKCDVLIEDNIGEDPRSGLPVFFGFIVWADDGMEETIRNVEGVHTVTEFHTCYHVGVDPRYDREYVKAEIEAAILCAPGKDEHD